MRDVCVLCGEGIRFEDGEWLDYTCQLENICPEAPGFETEHTPRSRLLDLHDIERSLR